MLPALTRVPASLALTLALAAGCSPKDGGDDGSAVTGTQGEGTSTGTGETGGTETGVVTGVVTTGGEGELVCPAAIEAGIVACVAELQADPELAPGNFLLDLVWMCGDAEPVAGGYDAHCAGAPEDPICALEYPEFVEQVLPQCVEGAQETVFAGVCLLPGVYRELLFVPGVALMSRRFISSAADLDETEQQQLLRTSAALGFPVATVEEALQATDDDGFEQLTVLAVGTRRVLVLYTAYYGDTMVGRMFFRQTFTVVGAVSDGDFGGCGVERGLEGQPCAGPEDPSCGPELVCTGVVAGEGPGACVAGAPVANEGLPCEVHDDCEPGGGLLCLAAGYQSPAGLCQPGWMRRSFTAELEGAALVAGGSTTVPIVVSGVGAAPTTAYLDLSVGQEAANGLRVRLVSPLGDTSTVIETGDQPTVDVVLAGEEVAVAGDGPANGVWQLVIDDLGGAASGAVFGLGLTLDTRRD